MTEQKLNQYRSAKDPLPAFQYAWPLYGSELPNLGQNGKPVVRPIPDFGSDELLVRIDAVSLCYTDLKEVSQGENHPRLKGRDLKTDPIVPGHELCMTVVGVGSELANTYEIGQRFTVQPDVWKDGKSIPFCFGMDGAYRQFAVIDQRILNGDAGNYLIPVPKDMTYAAAAITEPWACVEAAYRMNYRSLFKSGGNAVFFGGSKTCSDYSIRKDWLASSKPARFYLCELPQKLHDYLVGICEKLGIEVKIISADDIKSGLYAFDDIVLLDDAISQLSDFDEKMAKGAVIVLAAHNYLPESIKIDLGRLHYDEIFYVGTTELQIDSAFRSGPIRVEFKPGGIAWILGAGGPMGRMHLQRAIESPTGPKTIVASEVSEVRLESTRQFFSKLALDNQKNLIVINPVAEKEQFTDVMHKLLEKGGVDDVEVMVTISRIIEEAIEYLAPNGVMNMFAGVKRGEKINLNPVVIAGNKQARFVGHSGSGLDDQKAVVTRCISSELNTDLSVAAIGGLNQIAEGIQAMHDSVFPGKIVIYPQILNFPLTGLSTLHEQLPDVAALLGANETWTSEAESAFLESQLP